MDTFSSSHTTRTDSVKKFLIFMVFHGGGPGQARGTVMESIPS